MEAPAGPSVWRLTRRLGPPIARGTSCPGHVLVPWAHSPIWSRQGANFVSLIQIASYKRWVLFLYPEVLVIKDEDIKG